ncbi:MAG: hypothetical protein AAF512_12840, partial [Pseudomonadota bacterium]
MKVARLNQYFWITVLTLFSANAFAFKMDFKFDLVEKDWSGFEEEGPMGKGTLSVTLPDEVKKNEVRLQKLIWNDGVLDTIKKSKAKMEKRLDKLHKEFEDLSSEKRKEEVKKFNNAFKKEKQKLRKKVDKEVEKIWEAYKKDLEDASAKVLEARIELGFEITKTSLKVGATYASTTATGGLALAGTVLSSWSSLKELYGKMDEYSQGTADARDDLKKALDEYKSTTTGIWGKIKDLKGRGNEILDEIKKEQGLDPGEELDKKLEEIGKKMLSLADEGEGASWADWVNGGFETTTKVGDIGLKALEPASSKLKKSLENYEKKLAFEVVGSDNMGSEVSELLDKIDGLESDSGVTGWLRTFGLAKGLEPSLDGVLQATTESQGAIAESKDLIKEVNALLDNTKSIDNTFETIEKSYGLLKSLGETS